MQQTANLGLNKPAGTDVVNIDDLNANADILDAKLGASGHSHDGTAGNGPKLTAAGLAAGAADDTAIGNRTITDTVAAASGAGTITNLLSKIGYMIKGITGKSNWYTLPAITLEAINNLFGVAGHSHNGTTGQGPKIAYSNITGTPTSLPANGGTSAACSGNAATATKLQTARKINGVSFDGSADITITAAANGGNADTLDGYHASAFMLAGTPTGNQVKVIAGTVNHSEDVPLPPGYNEDQCVWFVSPNQRTVDDNDTIQCYTGTAVFNSNPSGRVVTNWTAQRGGALTNYICIGVK